MKKYFDNIPSKNLMSLNENERYFNFLGTKISEYEINSHIPFFNCQVDGHKEHLLDSICIN